MKIWDERNFGHTEIQPAPGELFDNTYFNFVYFLHDKCLLENSAWNEAGETLRLHSYIL